MEFCPTCGSMLQYELPYMGCHSRFFCSACPYVCPIDNKIKRKQRLVRKETEDIVIDGDKVIAPITDARCPKCGHGKAGFREFQTRSADEPATITYCCLECKNEWQG
ncbi:DNA-directed RNA polymerase III subunit RPC10 [Cajanus cajan]|uniref:DNA-directed RNA polymerase subunit n=1 Tax=Cajanus cajan TaxID=3821 RepID=A0A151QZJ7_CAJCA|nr:DNA-directed RNA polymerase III subunit RPC10 [Cajanus cajan]KYP35761.1 DNA-directed RNA polymerase subunit M [Cajanus cajan]